MIMATKNSSVSLQDDIEVSPFTLTPSGNLKVERKHLIFVSSKVGIVSTDHKLTKVRVRENTSKDGVFVQPQTSPMRRMFTEECTFRKLEKLNESTKQHNSSGKTCIFTTNRHKYSHKSYYKLCRKVISPREKKSFSPENIFPVKREEIDRSSSINNEDSMHTAFSNLLTIRESEVPRMYADPKINTEVVICDSLSSILSSSTFTKTREKLLHWTPKLYGSGCKSDSSILSASVKSILVNNSKSMDSILTVPSAPGDWGDISPVTDSSTPVDVMRIITNPRSITCMVIEPTKLDKKDGSSHSILADSDDLMFESLRCNLCKQRMMLKQIQYVAKGMKNRRSASNNAISTYQDMQCLSANTFPEDCIWGRHSASDSRISNISNFPDLTIVENEHIKHSAIQDKRFCRVLTIPPKCTTQHLKYDISPTTIYTEEQFSNSKGTSNSLPKLEIECLPRKLHETYTEEMKIKKNIHITKAPSFPQDNFQPSELNGTFGEIQSTKTVYTAKVPYKFNKICQPSAMNSAYIEEIEPNKHKHSEHIKTAEHPFMPSNIHTCSIEMERTPHIVKSSFVHSSDNVKIKHTQSHKENAVYTPHSPLPSQHMNCKTPAFQNEPTRNDENLACKTSINFSPALHQNCMPNIPSIMKKNHRKQDTTTHEQEENSTPNAPKLPQHKRSPMIEVLLDAPQMVTYSSSNSKEERMGSFKEGQSKSPVENNVSSFVPTLDNSSNISDKSNFAQKYSPLRIQVIKETVQRMDKPSNVTKSSLLESPISKFCMPIQEPYPAIKPCNNPNLENISYTIGFRKKDGRPDANNNKFSVSSNNANETINFTNIPEKHSTHEYTVLPLKEPAVYKNSEMSSTPGISSCKNKQTPINKIQNANKLVSVIQIFNNSKMSSSSSDYKSADSEDLHKKQNKQVSGTEQNPTTKLKEDLDSNPRETHRGKTADNVHEHAAETAPLKCLSHLHQAHRTNGTLNNSINPVINPQKLAAHNNNLSSSEADKFYSCPENHTTQDELSDSDNLKAIAENISSDQPWNKAVACEFNDILNLMCNSINNSKGEYKKKLKKYCPEFLSVIQKLHDALEMGYNDQSSHFTLSKIQKFHEVIDKVLASNSSWVENKTPSVLKLQALKEILNLMSTCFADSKHVLQHAAEEHYKTIKAKILKSVSRLIASTDLMDLSKEDNSLKLSQRRIPSNDIPQFQALAQHKCLEHSSDLLQTQENIPLKSNFKIVSQTNPPGMAQPEQPALNNMIKKAIVGQQDKPDDKLVKYNKEGKLNGDVFYMAAARSNVNTATSNVPVNTELFFNTTLITPLQESNQVSTNEIKCSQINNIFRATSTYTVLNCMRQEPFTDSSIITLRTTDLSTDTSDSTVGTVCKPVSSLVNKVPSNSVKKIELKRKITETNLSMSSNSSYTSQTELKELQQLMSDPVDWNKVDIPVKEDPRDLCARKAMLVEDPDCEVHIGEEVFKCHRMILAGYSNFFKPRFNHSVFEVPLNKVSSETFGAVYRWMTGSDEDARKEVIWGDMLSLLEAAQFLEISELEDQCWALIFNEEVFREETALQLYLQARLKGTTSVMEMMEPRISNFFLPLVGSTVWVKLPVDVICTLLSSNFISVHSEMEVFMSAVKWLNYDWTTRNKFVIEMMKCVRFGLVSAWQLVHLQRSSLNPEYNGILAFPEVQEMVKEGLSYSILRNRSPYMISENKGEIIPDLPEPDARNWMGNDRLYKTYQEFLQLLESYHQPKQYVPPTESWNISSRNVLTTQFVF